MAETRTYDAIVIGTGQGGKPLAAELARYGWKTAIIERDDRVGGTCVLNGCTPTKTMVASARVAHLVSRAGDYGIRTGNWEVNQAAVRQRKRDIVEMFSSGSRKGLEKWDGLDLIFGEASFASPTELRVRLNEGRELQLKSDRIFINTGARPAPPEIEGLDEVPFLDSTSVMELDRVPERLLVLGGGFIGSEFGQMFRRFGSEVAIVETGPCLMPREDREFGDALTEVFGQDGIELHFESHATEVGNDNGQVKLEIRTPGGTETLCGSHLLVAAGRQPNTDALRPEAAGVEIDERGYIRVNERLETAAPGIWALGDVTGGAAFTQVSYDDMRIIRSNLLGEGERSTADRLTPYVLFTDPQYARVGLSEKDARDRGLDYHAVSMPMGSVARALEMDETRGMIKALVERGTGQILGAAVLAVEGGEIMSQLQIAMMGRLPYTALRDGVFAHPTFAEAMNNLFAKVPE